MEIRLGFAPRPGEIACQHRVYELALPDYETDAMAVHTADDLDVNSDVLAGEIQHSCYPG